MAGLFMRQARSLRVRPDQVTSAKDITARQSIYPLMLVTTLFFLWGLAYGLLDTLNKHFQVTLGITRTRSSGLQAAYFGAYPLAALTYANWLLRHFGYKLTFMFGLTLYGIGALAMWPAGLHRSFGGFCGATFIIGSGLGTLETAANPYLAVCGPPKYAELRINLAQSFTAIGSVLGPVLGAYAFFKNTKDSTAAIRNVQWVYLAIAIFVFCLAGVFFFSTIPEITDADMAQSAEETHGGTDLAGDKPFRKQYRLFHAVFAQFCYVGSQVSIAGYFINYVTEVRPNTSNSDGAKFLSIAQGCFAIGRFIGTGLMKTTKPRYVFLLFYAGATLFVGISVGTRGNAGLAMLNLCLFFESVCFPTIVAIGIRGLGRHTKRGAGWIIGSVIGGACIPPLLAKVADIYNSTAIGMIVPTCVFLGGLTYVAAVNFVPSYRIQADSVEAIHTPSEPTSKSDFKETGRDIDV